MTDNQFIEIKNRAWNWYKRGMRVWSLATIKDFANAPQWAKDAICYYQGNAKIDFVFVIGGDDDDTSLLKKYDAQIDAMLRASQRLNFEVNYVKELLEFYEAHRDKDEYYMIDALCDMIIIALNAGAYLGNTYSEFTSENLVNALLYKGIHISSLVAEINSRGYDAYKCLCETVKELESRSGSWSEELGKWCKDLGAYTEEEAYEIAKQRGIFYNFGLEYDKETKEPYWVSDTNDSANWKKLEIKKWYKADYSGCKLAEQDPF